MQKYVWNQSNLLAILDAIDWIWIDMNWSHVLLLMTSLPPLPNHPIHEMTRKILFTTTLKKEVAYGLNFLLSKTVVEVMWRWQYPNQQLDRKRNIEKPSISGTTLKYYYGTVFFTIEDITKSIRKSRFSLNSGGIRRTTIVGVNDMHVKKWSLGPIPTSRRSCPNEARPTSNVSLWSIQP